MKRATHKFLAVLIVMIFLSGSDFGALAAQQIVSGTLQNDFNLAGNGQTWTLTMNDNNGSGTNVNAPKEYGKKTLVPQPANQPTYGTNHFEGWSFDSNVLGKVYNTQAALDNVELIEFPFEMHNNNITIYAVWSNLQPQVVNVTLSYASDASYTGSLPSSVTVESGQSITVAGGAGLSRAGYTFAGWKRKQSGNLIDPAYGPSWVPSISISTDTVLYAYWSPVSYTISYLSNLPPAAAGRMSNPNPSSYNIESSFSLQNASCTGYTFVGWYLSPGYEQSSIVTQLTQGSTGVRVFYAKFTVEPLSGLSLNSYDGVYDGMPHGVTLVDGDKQLLGSDTITYSTSNAYIDAMIAPQTVTVSIFRDGVKVKELSATVKIAKRPVTITADSSTVTYDSLPHSVTTWTVEPTTSDRGLVGSDAIQSVTLTDNTRTVVGECYPTPSGATFAIGNADNYNCIYESGLLKVTQRADLDVKLSAGEYVYDGTFYGYTVDTNGIPVTLEYRIDGVGTWQPVSDSNPLPTYQDAGIYVLQVRASNPNYSNTPTARATLTITPRDLTLNAGTLSEPYNGLPYTMTDWWVSPSTSNSGLVSGDGIISVILDDNTRTVPGSNDVGIAVDAWAPGTEPANYHVITVKGSITVTQSMDAPTIASADRTVTYDGNSHQLDYSVTVPEGTPYNVYYHTGDGVWIRLSQDGQLPGRRNAGIYHFYLKVESPWYANAGETSATLTIEPFVISAAQVELNGVNTVYDGDGHSIGLPEVIRTDLGNIRLKDEFDITYQSGDPASPLGPQAENPLFYDVGDYPVTVLLSSESGNFTVEPVTASVIITPRALTISYGTINEVYNGQTHTVPLDIEGLTSRDTIQLTEQNRTAVNVTRLPDGTLSALPTTATGWLLTDATDSTIDRADNYSVTVNPGTIMVTPRPLQVIVDSQTFVYDASLHTVSDLHSEGLLETQTLNAVLADNSAVNVITGQQITLASATITDDATGTDVTDNYAIESKLGTLTVTPAPLTLIVTTLGVVYDGLDHQPDVYAPQGLMGDDSLEAYSLLGMPQRAVGRYADVGLDLEQLVLMNPAGINVTSNYMITVQNGQLEIYAATAAYYVNYYYNGALADDATVTLNGVLGSTVNTYPPRLLAGYTLSRVQGLPLVLRSDVLQNVINVYYTNAPRPVTIADLEIPLGVNDYNFEEGLTVE